MTLEVAEACSGIRSICSLESLAIIYGYLLGAPVWKRLILALTTLAIAVTTNALRIIGTGVLAKLGVDSKSAGQHPIAKLAPVPHPICV
jgi:exosortase/archaeosortase family protein